MPRASAEQLLAEGEQILAEGDPVKPISYPPVIRVRRLVAPRPAAIPPAPLPKGASWKPETLRREVLAQFPASARKLGR